MLVVAADGALVKSTSPCGHARRMLHALADGETDPPPSPR
jgi:hypothetical protein